MRSTDLPSWQGANRIDALLHREDLQRRHGGKGVAHKYRIASNTTLAHQITRGHISYSFAIRLGKLLATTAVAWEFAPYAVVGLMVSINHAFSNQPWVSFDPSIDIPLLLVSTGGLLGLAAMFVSLSISRARLRQHSSLSRMLSFSLAFGIASAVGVTLLLAVSSTESGLSPELAVLPAFCGLAMHTLFAPACGLTTRSS